MSWARVHGIAMMPQSLLELADVVGTSQPSLLLVPEWLQGAPLCWNGGNRVVLR